MFPLQDNLNGKEERSQHSTKQGVEKVSVIRDNTYLSDGLEMHVPPICTSTLAMGKNFHEWRKAVVGIGQAANKISIRFGVSSGP